MCAVSKLDKIRTIGPLLVTCIGEHCSFLKTRLQAEPCAGSRPAVLNVRSLYAYDPALWYQGKAEITESTAANLAKFYLYVTPVFIRHGHFICLFCQKPSSFLFNDLLYTTKTVSRVTLLSQHPITYLLMRCCSFLKSHENNFCLGSLLLVLV